LQHLKQFVQKTRLTLRSQRHRKYP